VNEGGYELRIERLIDAPPEVVFDTFVEPEAQQELYGNDDDLERVVAEKQRGDEPRNEPMEKKGATR
jgi:uncharacterized protein YndB with AHSA1/START domain